MMGWSVRSLVNVAYAFLAEQMDAADRAAVPVYSAAGVKPEEVAKMSRRTAFDNWLAEPVGKAAEHERALLSFLGVAS